MRGFSLAVSRRLRSQEGGFTLIEVLVTVSLLAVVLGAALSLSDTGSKVAQKDIERAHAIEEVQTGIARMDRELRNATDLRAPGWGATANAVVFDVDVRPPGGGTRVAKAVRYDCSVPSPTNPALRACFRYEGVAGSTPGGSATLVIDGVVNGTTAAPVFATGVAPPSAPPQPTFVKIEVQRSAAGSLQNGYDYAIRLEHGVHLRNVSGIL